MQLSNLNFYWSPGSAGTSIIYNSNLNIFCQVIDQKLFYCNEYSFVKAFYNESDITNAFYKERHAAVKSVKLYIVTALLHSFVAVCSKVFVVFSIT